MKSLIAFFALSFSLAFSSENFGGIGLAEVSVNTGLNSLNWDGSNLPKGTYIVHFEHNGKIISSSAVLH
ncbi:hypothetical protein AGMMS49938_12140 [Fibrobacterales bacterium]|nr:hypothetical protein AGMMS49938_12140 [Fibrobacterales bacterium]